MSENAESIGTDQKKCQQPELEILLSRKDWQSAYFAETDGQRTCIMMRCDTYILIEAHEGRRLWLESRIPADTQSDQDFVRHFDPSKGIIKDLLEGRAEYNEKYFRRECANQMLHFLFGLKIKGVVPLKKV